MNVRVVGDVKAFEHTSAPGQSGVGPFLSTSTKNRWTMPSPLDSWIVTVSPCWTVIVGFGVLVLFQALKKPIRAMVPGEAAETFGGMFHEMIPMELTVNVRTRRVASLGFMVAVSGSFRAITSVGSPLRA